MTVIRLNNGDLFLHSPTEPTDQLVEQLKALGQVKFLISPNKIHYWWIGDWGEIFPDAVKYASPGVHASARTQGWSFDKNLMSKPDPAWTADIEQTVVAGGRFMEEVVFFHKTSRTLILADMIENFDPAKVHSYVLRTLMYLAGVLGPKGSTPRDIRLTFWNRHRLLHPSICQMIQWAPERIIVSHGACFDKNCVEELYRAFGWVKGLTRDKN